MTPTILGNVLVEMQKMIEFVWKNRWKWLKSWESRWTNRFESNRCHGSSIGMESFTSLWVIKKLLRDKFNWMFYGYVNELLVVCLIYLLICWLTIVAFLVLRDFTCWWHKWFIWKNKGTWLPFASLLIYCRC